MKKLLLLFALSIASQSIAQEITPCGTLPPSAEWETRFQELVTSQRNHQTGTVGSVYTIPVIFHIIHGGESPGIFPNIPQGQINSQITVLNEDFKGIGYNSNTYPTSAFVNWAINESLPSTNLDSSGRVRIADMNIQFCLAEYDTNGNFLTEPGIERIDYNAFGWANPNSFSSTNTMKAFLDGTVKPQTIWNPVKYLNIWITDRSVSLTFTGVATMPPLTGLPGIAPAGEGTDSTDGIWCYAGTVGSPLIYPSGLYASPGVRGRTITHEVGHYVGLRHIWGDGTCADDYCNDTPPAYTQNTGGPSYPLNAGSCAGNSPDGEMFMNFMDYPSDPNKYMFTPDQAARAQIAMTNSPMRNQLGTHGLCNIPSGEAELQHQTPFVISPNPASDVITLNGTPTGKFTIKIFTMSGQLLLTTDTATINLDSLSQGTYILCIETETKTTTQRFVRL